MINSKDLKPTIFTKEAFSTEHIYDFDVGSIKFKPSDGDKLRKAIRVARGEEPEREHTLTMGGLGMME
jgi:hypothetical protein